MNEKEYERLLQGVKQMHEIMQGKRKPSRVFVFEAPDVREVRERTGLSQGHFATLIGVSKRTLENWEQGRRQPTGPAMALLRIFAADPEHAVKALHGRKIKNRTPDSGKGVLRWSGFSGHVQ